MFKYDGPLVNMINKVIDFILLGMIWFIMCLPIITIGASTTASYYVAFNLVEEKGGYFFKGFFKSFKENFVQSTLIFIISTLIICMGILNLRILTIYQLKINEILYVAAAVTQLILIFEAVIFSYFGYAILSKIELTNKNLLKSTIIIANTHLPTAFFNSLVIFTISFIGLAFPVLLIFSGGAYLLLSTLLLKKVVVKYKPEVFE